MSAPHIDTLNPCGITPKDLDKLGALMLNMPFYMANLGHHTIGGHMIYISQVCTPLERAYMSWYDNQTDATRSGLVKAYGGNDVFRRICHNLAKATSNKMMEVT